MVASMGMFPPRPKPTKKTTAQMARQLLSAPSTIPIGSLDYANRIIEGVRTKYCDDTDGKIEGPAATDDVY